ncbi:MAG: hypothetical protein DDT31_01755 [Syntrophomonadaceae bacterium]|nr:hypothetical protein [Bacillota bacterium]
MQSPDTNENTRTVNVIWNPYFQGTSVRVTVTNENSCGASDSASTVFNINRLPDKPLSITSNVATRVLCQPRANDVVSVTFGVTQRPGTVNPSLTDGYRWAFERVPGPINAPYAQSAAVPVVLPADLDEYSTNTANITVQINPEFFGWFRAVAAFAGTNCNGFDDNSRGIGQGFSIPTSSAIGDTLTYFFFISPRVRDRAIRELPTGRKVLCRSGNVDTLTFTYPQPPVGFSTFATRYTWEVFQAPNGPNPALFRKSKRTKQLFKWRYFKNTSCKNIRK